ncbi:unnamed protein product [Polarella glacialis]|uniref:NADP-dependent oxidoreductase domain-containing protein n=1 Tax=Polarella glacialis TaxID=89957 RepID=A0A813DQ40_POLGL|nr:unnamed protein product [Polarella glacialis]
MTSLLSAARGGHAEVVKLLVQAGANMEDGSDALLHAASGGSAQVAAALLGAKANIETVNEDEVTPLLLAAYYGHTEVVRVLIEAGADVNHNAPGWGCALDSASGDTAVLLAAAAPRAGEFFSYGSLDGDNAEAALRQFTPAAGVLGAATQPQGPALEVGTEATGSSGSASSPLSRLGQMARTVGALCEPICGDLGSGAGPSSGLRPAAAEEPAANRATPSGTARYLDRNRIGLPAKTLERSGLKVSPVGFGCHRVENCPDNRNALTMAIKCGCNFIDVAPNYTDGGAESAVGAVLRELFSAGDVRRDELVISTKVGNIVGSALKKASLQTMPGVAKVRDDVWHCLEPAWIEEELTGSLERLGLECVDVLLLHCPEFATKASDIDIDEVYRRIQRAFVHLEKEVQSGRIARYGITAAFYPLRPTDPEHLLLDRVLELLPSNHHFEVIQFPLNFAEPHPLWVGHTARGGDGAAIDQEKGLEAPSLVEMAKNHGISTLVNRPLDGLYKEMRGVLRFSSDVPMNSEMQSEDKDGMEQKLTTLCKGSLGDLDDPVTENLAAKTVKCLASLDGVDCVLVGMRQVDYVASVVRLLSTTPVLSPEVARSAVKALHETVEMWFCMASGEDDHGTAKEWRLPSLG